MRAIISYFALIAIFVWMASEGGFDRVDRGHLPIANSKAPTYISDLPLPDPHQLDDLAVVPAARAAGTFTPEMVTVTGGVVNLRAGPGLSYRMIDVVERGFEMKVNGEQNGVWVPVVDPKSGLEAWIHNGYINLK